LYPENHPLGIVFDENNVCSGCRVHEEKDSIDWNKKWEKLTEIALQYKLKKKSTYDCIVPVTGAHDSYFIVHTVKNRLGLNPLLVSYNKYFNTPLGIYNLANLRRKFDCDILIQNINPISVKKITRTTLRRFGSMYWPCIAGQTVYPVQTAVQLGIPLIIWGAHQGLEQVGMFSHNHEVEMTRRYRKEHDLMGYEADDLLDNFDVLKEDDIWQYRYPHDDDLKKNGVKGIYLGNYVRWDSRAQHEDMIRHYKFRSASIPTTFDTYDHVDCYNYMGIHDYIKKIKTGYGKVLDHAVREIRHKRITREEGLLLVHKYISIPPPRIELFTKWLGIDERSLKFVIEQHKCKDDLMLPQENSYIDKSRYSTTKYEKSYIINSTVNMEKNEKYITIGKGYP